MENRFGEMEDELEEIQDINDDLEDGYDSKTRKLNKLEENLSKLCYPLKATLTR